MATTPNPVFSTERTNAPVPIAIIETIYSMERRISILEKTLAQNTDSE